MDDRNDCNHVLSIQEQIKCESCCLLFDRPELAEEIRKLNDLVRFMEMNGMFMPGALKHIEGLSSQIKSLGGMG